MKKLYKNGLLFLFVQLSLFNIVFSQECNTNIIPAKKFGGQEELLYVTSEWEGYGFPNLTYNYSMYIDNIYDVNDYYIFPNGLGMGQLINELLSNLNLNEINLIYFPPGVYKIDEPINVPHNTIIKGAGGDMSVKNQTHFKFIFPSTVDGHCITLNGPYSGLEDVSLVDENWLFIYHEPKHMVKIIGNLCWVRGVESENTRQFHVSISGNTFGVTISGCYFHDAHDYSNRSESGGLGYGVQLTGYAHSCRIENNVFRHLRHSIVLQGDVNTNVIGYNYSRDVYGCNYPGGNPNLTCVDYSGVLGDLEFHGRPGSSYDFGPYWNLSEGNYVVRIKFDNDHNNDGGNNGPYNTLFRCKADDYLKVEKDKNGGTNQYKQNIVGSNAWPFNDNTRQRILDYGYSYYWDGPPDYSQIPADQCSYYYSERPLFYDFSTSWLEWPFVANNIIPAKYRYDRNNGYYIEYPPVTEVVNAGWDLYADVCGPPKYYITNGALINNAEEEYLAMERIEAGPYILNANNNIVFKAMNSIILKPGFKVVANNNHFRAIVGSPCENNGEFSLKEFEPTNKKIQLFPQRDQLSFQEINQKNSIVPKKELGHDRDQFDDKIEIYPNPSKGKINLRLNRLDYINPTLIITNLNDEVVYRPIRIDRDQFSIELNNLPKGLYFLKIISEKQISVQKLILN